MRCFEVGEHLGGYEQTHRKGDRALKELFNKAISVSILIGAGTIALWHKEGVNAWTVAGAIAFYFSAIATGFILKKWTEKIKSLEE